MTDRIKLAQERIAARNPVLAAQANITVDLVGRIDFNESAISALSGNMVFIRTGWAEKATDAELDSVIEHEMLHKAAEPVYERQQAAFAAGEVYSVPTDEQRDAIEGGKR